MSLDPDITRPLTDWNKNVEGVNDYQETEAPDLGGTKDYGISVESGRDNRKVAQLNTERDRNRRIKIDVAKRRERDRIYNESQKKNPKIRPAPNQKKVENIFFELPPEPKPYSAFLRSQGKTKLQPSELRSFLGFIDIALSRTKNVIPIATNNLDRWRNKLGGIRHLPRDEYNFSTQDVDIKSVMFSNEEERNHYENLANGIRNRFNRKSDKYVPANNYAAIYWMASVPANEGLGGTLDDVLKALANQSKDKLKGTLSDVLRKLGQKDKGMFTLPPVWDRFFAIGGYTIVSEIVIFRGTYLKDVAIEEFNFQIYDRYDWWHDSLKEESGKDVPLLATEDDLKKYPIIEHFAAVRKKIPFTDYNYISIDSKLFMLIEEAGGGKWFDIITDIYHGDKTMLRKITLGEVKF